MRSAALELDLDVAAHRRGWHLQIFHWKTGPRECARGGRPAEGTDQTVNQDSPHSRDSQPARQGCRCAPQPSHLFEERHSYYQSQLSSAARRGRICSGRVKHTEDAQFECRGRSARSRLANDSASARTPWAIDTPGSRLAPERRNDRTHNPYAYCRPEERPMRTFESVATWPPPRAKRSGRATG